MITKYLHRIITSPFGPYIETLILWVLFKDKLSPVQKIIKDVVDKVKKNTPLVVAENIPVLGSTEFPKLMGASVNLMIPG